MLYRCASKASVGRCNLAVDEPCSRAGDSAWLSPAEDRGSGLRPAAPARSTATILAISHYEAGLSASMSILDVRPLLVQHGHCVVLYPGRASSLPSPELKMGSISRFVVVNELGCSRTERSLKAYSSCNHEYRRVLDPNGRVDVVSAALRRPECRGPCCRPWPQHLGACEGLQPPPRRIACLVLALMVNPDPPSPRASRPTGRPDSEREIGV